MTAARTQTATSTSPSPADHATVLYDRDCGLCRAIMGAVLALDRQSRLRPVALQSPEAAALLPGLDEEERMASFHVVRADGVALSGGEALSELMDFLAGGRPLGVAMRRAPALTDRAYRLIADNRARIGPLVPDALKRRATAAIDRRP